MLIKLRDTVRYKDLLSFCGLFCSSVRDCSQLGDFAHFKTITQVIFEIVPLYSWIFGFGLIGIFLVSAVALSYD